MNADIFSVSYDASTSLWSWTRLPFGNPAALKRYSQEKFVKIQDAVLAAKGASIGNGLFSFPFDSGQVSELRPKSEGRTQWLLQQVREAKTMEQLEEATKAIFAYDLTLYHTANRTMIAYRRTALGKELAAKIQLYDTTDAIQDFLTALGKELAAKIQRIPKGAVR